MARRRRQELWCHACDHHVQFICDLSLDGNHVLHCPNCGHEHCRVVKDGVITDIRWDQRNGPTWIIAGSSTSSSVIQVYISQTSTAWLGTTTGY